MTNTTKTLKVEHYGNYHLYNNECHLRKVWMNYGRSRKLVSFQLTSAGWKHDYGKAPRLNAEITAAWEDAMQSVLTCLYNANAEGKTIIIAA